MNSFYKFIVLVFVLIIGLSSCEKDADAQQRPFVVAFADQFISHYKVKDSYKIKIVLSKKASFDGMVTVRVISKNADYDVDFTTAPSIDSKNEFQIPFKAGEMSTEFTYENLIFPFDRFDKAVEFEIVNVVYPEEVLLQGYSRTVVSFAASLGGVIAPEVGGPSQPFQVYVELSSGDVKEVARTSWDLAFSSELDRVKLNGSIYMAAKKLNSYDIDLVNESQVSSYFPQVAIGTFDPTNENYIDAPSGDLTKTAIAEIKEDDADNAVYLVNLGFEPGKAVNPAGADVTGDHRGWRKIRILKREDKYLLQYASLNESTHREVLISKNEAYNFNFFSMKTQSEVSVEPLKDKWDLNFTVFTNIIEGSGSYGYSDFVSNNVLGKVRIYSVVVSGANAKDLAVKLQEAYTNVVVNPSKFSNDQRVIGADWRDVFTGEVLKDRFYVLEDAKGNYYKIKMMSMLNESVKRGYPKFEYELIF